MFTIIFFFTLSLGLDNFDYFESNHLSYCDRYLSIQGQFGCSSSAYGSYGIIKILSKLEEVDAFANEIHSERYIPVIDYDLFQDKATMNRLKSLKFVSGVVVTPFYELEKKYSFSENSVCPNPENSLYSYQCSKNYVKNASSFIYENWPFPIVHLSGDKLNTLNKIKKCYYDFNKSPVDDTRCSLEIKNYMFGIGNSMICIRRTNLIASNFLDSDSPRYCENLPMSSSLIHLKTFYNVTERKKESTLLLLTRVDSRGLFDKSSFGQTGTAVSIAIMLSLVSNLMKDEVIKNNISSLMKDATFGFIDSDEFEYTGSKTFVQKLFDGQIAKNTGAPLTMNSISSVIEIGLLGNSNPKNKLFMMTDNTTLTKKRSEIEILQNHLKSAGQKNKIDFEISKEQMLPPLSSVQMLLKKDRSLNHILITDSDKTFNDDQFDSIFDNSIKSLIEKENELDEIVNSIKTFVIRELLKDSLYEVSKIKYHRPIEFLKCFQNDEICTLFLELMPDLEIEQLSKLMQPISMQHYSENLPGVSFVVSELVSRLLIYLTGTEYHPKGGIGDCPTRTNSGKFYYHILSINKGDICYQTNIEIYDFSESSNISPFWIKSQSDVSKRFVRLYRSASGLLDLITFIIGLIFTIAVILILVILKYYMKIDLDSEKDEINPNMTHHSASGSNDTAETN